MSGFFKPSFEGGRTQPQLMRYLCFMARIHFPVNSVCFTFQSEAESGGKKAQKKEAEAAKRLVLTDHVHLPLQVSSDHKMAETNNYLPNCTNLLELVLQYTVLLSLCEYTTLEFNSTTYVICKEMKQDCHN